MFQFFVNQRLLAARAGFLFEVLDDSRIQIDIDALFEGLNLPTGIARS